MFFRQPSTEKVPVTQFFLLRLTFVLFVVLCHTSRAANFYAGTSPANVPWPGGIVPYEFTNALTTAQQQTYLDGLREWELAANVHFVPHTTQMHWVLFTYNTNGFDNVSATTNPQVVSVASLSRAQVGHEMGHSFGFNHENIRPDAANFITVVTNNITPGNLQFFQIDPTTVTNGPYDFESVMHLGWDFGSMQPGVLATQQPKPPNSPRYQFRMGNFCLSPGDRAALKFLYGAPALPLTNIVTTTAEVGPGSLRAAMYYVQDHSGAIVKFNIPTSDSGFSNGVFNIHLTGVLPTLAANCLVIDGSTQPGFTGKPLIIVDGSQILPETFTSNSGLLIYSASNQVKNISFSGFNWNGLTFEYADATNNTISGCWLGLDSAGSNAAPNAGQGILFVQGASHNIIGGTNALARNVISGNGQYGLWMSDTNTVGNIILGNYIGTDASGSFAVPNPLGGIGIFTNGIGHIIGGASAGAGNVISGNGGPGIWLSGASVSNNMVQGNYIGPDATGANAIGNDGFGIEILNNASGNFIGAAGAGAGNLVSGQTGFSYGIVMNGASRNVIQGNFIGTDFTGKNPLANGFTGVAMWGGSTNNLIGGTSLGSGNVISGNGSYGVYISDTGTAGNLVQGNIIGADVTGTNALGNGFANVILLGGATGNIIGGTGADAGNLIAFAGSPGVTVYDDSTTNNSIRGNSIFSNGRLGIDLVDANNTFPFVTPNDPGDTDTGPNDLQNFPVITNAFGFGGGTIISGTLNSTANRPFLIDVYRNDTADSSGFGEGQFYIGTVSATTDGSGNASFSFTNHIANYSGQYISATATAAGGDTSEFSADVLAGNVLAPFAQFGNNFSWNASQFNFSLTLQTNFSYRIQTTTNLANAASWIDLTNFTATNSIFSFTDRTATNKARFYRVVSP
jgi:parallel beta-helix repeat protein